MDPIGADQKIAPDFVTVRKARRDAIFVFVNPNTFVVEVNYLLPHRVQENTLQVRSMQTHENGTICPEVEFAWVKDTEYAPILCPKLPYLE
jgi:hypothetical protein